MIYLDLEKILVPEKNVKQNPDESYMSTNNIKIMLVAVLIIN